MKLYYEKDTIAALSTPPGEGGIAVIRISGPDSVNAALSLYRSRSGKKPEFSHHTMHFGLVTDPETDETIDEAIFLIMKAPHSYTCEDVAEIQCHGGMAAVSKILGVLRKLNIRAALPGEFTKRAFLNGRINLIQAEAVMDIIKAKTEPALQSAEKQLSGKFSKELDEFKNDVLDIVARIEAPLEYPEEDLIQTDDNEIIDDISALVRKALNMVKLCKEGRIRRSGLRAAIVGKPNVGKSSLMNILLCEERAIVTEVAGTTRDIIEESCNIGGMHIVLCDTAGIRQTDDKVEKMGVKRSFNVISDCDFIIMVLDVSAPFDEEDRAVAEFISQRSKDCVIVFNKSDRKKVMEEDEVTDILPEAQTFFVSVKSHEGLEDFKSSLSDKMTVLNRAGSDYYFLSSQRHCELLEKLISSLEFALDTIKSGFPPDMLLVGLRDALSILAELSGESFDEAVLDRIFNEFCVGK